ncbi:MAG: hypothetical protein Q4E35_07950 [Eubacteriales bacterium]|nr:hypothetical protein [Eubacteriales bacterium]
MEVSKSDWSLYRKKIAGWQESFMEKLCAEYAAILSDSSIAASERFWTLERRIKEDKRLSGVQVEMRKSNMRYDLARLVAEEAITLDDLSEFSTELQEAVRMIIRF